MVQVSGVGRLAEWEGKLGEVRQIYVHERLNTTLTHTPPTCVAHRREKRGLGEEGRLGYGRREQTRHQHALAVTSPRQ